MSRARVAVVVGNPKPQSRTLHAATRLARELVGRDPDQVVDLADLGPRILDWDDEVVAELVADVGASDLVVVGSPTYKGTYTGLLKLFLDRFPTDGLRGVAVPLMLGAGPGHALAPELTLRPVLTEIGGLVPAKGLYVVDSAYDDPSAYEHWLGLARPAITAVLASRTADTRTGVPA
ncbi:NADPH-dependent FMN reductase [Nocardioides sp.]|uniref:NADPH-dependent FMN reductase n=1 Tax=Nocardioides sp. TaxID=35761 RepID=UPI00378511D1